MAPCISQDKIVQQLSYSVNSQITDIQNKVRQENKNQQSKENENTEEVNSEETKIYTNDHTSIGSDDGLLGNSITASTEQQETVESIGGDISERINAATNAFASVGQIDNTISEEVNKAETLTTTSVKSIEENLDGKVKDISEETTKSSSIYDEIYRERETKARLIVGTSDTNYSRDKGGNYRMVLMYDSGNNITFSKDDNPVIIIKNDAVKNVGGFHKFCSEIEKECEQKMSEGKKYYYENYLKDHGFIEKEVDLDKLMKELEALRSEVMKKIELICK